MINKVKSLVAYFAVCLTGFLMVAGVVAFANTNNGIYPFAEGEAVYLEGEACTVNLEDHITQQYAANMLSTCLEYHELYLEKISIIQGE